MTGRLAQSAAGIMLLALATLASAAASDAPLHEAARHGEVEIVRSLLDAGHDVDALDRGRWTPLVWAAAYLHDDVLQLLIAAGANLEAIGRAGINSGTALMWATKKPLSHATARLLLDAGADPNGTDQYGRTALMMAARTGQIANLRLLIERGANVDAVNRLPARGGRTALEIARRWRQGEAVALLRRAGAREWPELVAAGLAPPATDDRAVEAVAE